MLNYCDKEDDVSKISEVRIKININHVFKILYIYVFIT